MAWVGLDGTVTVVSLNAGNNQPLNLDGEKAKHVELSADGGTLLVVGRSDAFVFQAGSSGFTRIAKIENTTQAVLNPRATQVAYVDLSQKRLAFLNLDASLNAVPAVALDSTEVYDLSWSSASGEILYWARTAAGQAEVRAVSLKKSTEEKISDLSIPDGVTSGVVCPVEVDGQVFFGTVSNNFYVIQKYSEDTGASVFIQPEGYEEGYICPKKVENFAGSSL